MSDMQQAGRASAPMARGVEPAVLDGTALSIVGIGASAGGLAAFTAFFSSLAPDADPGMAFVLVQHLAPDHRSLLPDLIRRCTHLPVFEIEDGMRVAPNCIYTAPPGRDVACLNGSLHLLEPEAARGHRLPIDFFFRSLAQDLRERAIGIVLSGTGSDGAQGVLAIKAAGGWVLAQDAAGSDFDGMPRSAVATGAVDLELAPDAMMSELIARAARAASSAGMDAGSVAVPRAATDGALQKIFVLLRTSQGHDFSQYKPSTLCRRIERRMAAHQIPSMPLYVRYLQQTPAEVDALFRDLLIGVTRFFRDAEVFQALQSQVIPMLLARHSAGTSLRIWCPGCSTGEEAYSIAMLLCEQLEFLAQDVPLQVFGSDIDNRAIASARAGLYPASVAADVGTERLARHFRPEPGDAGFRVHKDIRDKLVFSVQNVIRDPPISKLDLISCRNLLIYLNAELQTKLLQSFHYALNPGGFLLLGNSESVGSLDTLFATHDRQLKLYRRKEMPDDISSTASPDPAPPARHALAAVASAPRPVRGLTQSANEDLQATNEELETSKEELQSLNEQLATVIAERQAKVQELSRANNDMNNLLAGTGIATVFVDPELRILRFTPTATELINLMAVDIGRPVAHIASNLVGYRTLVADTEGVLETLLPIAVDVQTERGRWFTMRIQPYRTLDNVVEGAVITFVDITEIVHTREALKKANEVLRLAVVVRDAHDAITVQDLDGRTLAWNPGAARLYGWSEADALAMNVRERIPRELQARALSRMQQLSRAEVLKPYRTQRITKSGAVIEVSMISTALVNDAGQMYAIATTERACHRSPGE